MQLPKMTNIGCFGVIGGSVLACLSTFFVPKPVSAGYFCSAFGPEAPKPWCGGTSDPNTELSCSPFNYRPWTTNNNFKRANNGKDPQYCTDSDVVNTLAGGPFNTTRAWMFFKDNRGSRDSNYWVFHGCDGAGIMPDCKGDIFYVERIFERSQDQSTVWCQGTNGGSNITLSQVPQHAHENGADRRQCQFKHPGTGTVYKNYEAGVWGWNLTSIRDDMVASAAAKEEGREWGYNVQSIVQGVKTPFGSPAIVMVTYPWVCTGAGGKDDPTGLFTNPRTPGAKCYWDNEPLTDGKGGNGYPPQIQVYWMKLGKDGAKDFLTVYGYYLDTNGVPSMKRMNNGQSWRLYPCHGECPW